MPLAIPTELKKITPFIRRAEELDKDKSNAESRLVAYYCRQYAVHAGIPTATSADGKQCLSVILNDLESEKEPMSNFTRGESKFLCGEFATRIFEKADEEDRTGTATKNTAKVFYAAASFLEMLNQFYADDDESEEISEIKKKTKYCKWKATDILKALKEGRAPTPGGYGEYEQEDEIELPPAGETAAPPPISTVPPVSPPMIPPTPPSGPPHVETIEDEGQEIEMGLGGKVNFEPPPAYPGANSPNVPPPPMPPTIVPKPPIVPILRPPMPAPVVAPPQPKPSGGSIFGSFGGRRNTSSGKTSKQQFQDAIELTNFALAALQEKDDDLAAQRLQQALSALGK